MYEAGLVILLAASVIGFLAVTLVAAEWLDKRKTEKRIRDRW